MGKTRVFFKKIGDTEGKFYAKIGTTKDKNGKGPAESKENKKRRNTEELYKKALNDPDNHKGVVTHLKPGILDCEVK